MKKFLVFFVCASIMAITTNPSYAQRYSVASFYGTYTYEHPNFTKVFELKKNSKDEWTKYGEDRSSNLYFKDYATGKWVKDDSQTLTWEWDLNKGVAKVYYDRSLRYVVDLKGKKVYDSWGNYLDGEGGHPFTKY